MTEIYSAIEIGLDCLAPDMKRARFETKNRIMESNPITDDELLNNASLSERNDL